ncbi:hypothetical protein YC2023_038758 [Brassica napus]
MSSRHLHLEPQGYLYSCLKSLIVLITCPLNFRLEDQWYSHWLLKERLESERCFKCYAMSLS